MSTRTTPSRPHVVTPPCDELKKMLNQGMTQLQIAQAWGQKTGYEPTRSAIGNAIARCKLESAHPRPRYEELVPKGVRGAHQKSLEAVYLRFLGRRRAGLSLTHEETGRLDKFLRDLIEQDAIVCYSSDPWIDGWFWAPRDDKEQMVKEGFFVYDPYDTNPPGQ